VAFTLPEGVTLRPIADGDMPFLGQLYAATRADEIAASGWTLPLQQRFLAEQFHLQHRYYQRHHAGAEFLLVLRGGSSIGRLYWRDDTAEASLIDISLLHAERGRGLGTSLLQARLARADERGQAVGLCVEPHNPALRLYHRLGFAVMDDNGIYLKMRRPAAADPRSPAP
jgi:ribosomal protein S18 acetylase RimI-like enzyme